MIKRCSIIRFQHKPNIRTAMYRAGQLTVIVDYVQYRPDALLCVLACKKYIEYSKRYVIKIIRALVFPSS